MTTLVILVAPAFADARGTLSRAEMVARALTLSGGPAERRAAMETAARLRRRLPISNPELSIELEGAPQPFSGREYTRRLRLEQELDLRGQRGARQQVGMASANLVEREAVAREQAIAAGVDEAVGKWLVARRRTVLLEPIRERAHALRHKADTARQRETLAGFDSRLLQAEALGRESEWIEARRELEAAEAELRIWTGLPEEDSLSLQDDLDALPWRCSADSLMARAREFRPDLARAAAAESLAAARLRFEQSVARANPRIGISAGRERLSLDGPFPSGELSDLDNFVGLDFTMPLPIFPADPSGTAQASAELAQARAERTVLEREMRREVAVACAAIGRGQERKRAIQQAAATAGGDLELVEQAYRGGRIPLEQYLTLTDRLIRLQLEVVEATGTVEAARNALVSATGLSREELQRQLETP
ncbi:MAG: TolC family protein [Candidatus Eisenbacteria bacterium]